MKRWSVAAGCFVVGIVAGAFVAGPLLRGQPQPVAPAPPSLPREPSSFRDVVKKVLPAVVSIEARGADVRRAPAVEPSFGSGFLIDPTGVVVTNYHVVEGAARAEVTLADGRKFLSKDIKADPKTDLVVIRLEAKGLPFLELGDSDDMEIGDRVLAVGAPFGLKGSVTAGIVSGKGRSLHLNQYEDFLQTDAAINPGNSGGPLVNLDGRVIGITSAIKSRSGGFQGVGLAIPSNLVKNVVGQLQRDGVVRRAYFGVQVKEIEGPEVAARLGLKRGQGVLVTHTYDGSPAARAGVRPGDVIVSLDGRAVADSRALQRVVAELPLHRPVEVALVRDTKPQTLRVTLVEQPADFGTGRVALPRGVEGVPAGVRFAAAGLDAADLTPELVEAFGFRQGTTGVVVTHVHSGGLAERAGLRPGMLLLRIERQRVTATTALADRLDEAALTRGVLVQVFSPQGGTNFALLKVGE